jgi:hypothetical protein
VSAADVWIRERTDGAPSELRERVLRWVALTDPDHYLPERLALAGHAALEAAVHSGRDRSVALDLLAADALVTLSLQAQAERDPARLGAFAQAVRRQGLARS